MTSKEHAEVWRKAARVVAALDPRMAPSPPGWGRSYSVEEAATWSSYSAAAVVLAVIATEYEKLP